MPPHRLAPLLLAGLVPACDSALPEARRAADAVLSEAELQRKGTERAIEEKLDELDRRLEEARTTVRRARQTKAQAARRVEELEREGRELRLRLEEARRSGARAWGDVEKAIDATMIEIEKTLGVSEQGQKDR